MDPVRGGQPAPEQSKSYVGEGAVLRGTRGPVIAQDHTSSVVGLANAIRSALLSVPVNVSIAPCGL